MRKLLFLLCTVAACVSFQANAQTFKFGHVNAGEIMQSLVEKDSIMTKLEKTQKELEAILNEAATEYRKKLDDFNANQSTSAWSTVVKDAKQAEIIDLQRRIEIQRQNADTKLEQEYQKLLEPIQKKFKDAVDKIGKSNGFTYIFNISAGNPIYFNETQSTDIGALVKKELGLK
jgi:outer membrane protein